jgi:hypothetical protein
MKWRTKEYQDTNTGYWSITYNRFLLLPKKINGEWRWLEKAQWLCRKEGIKWVKISWLN